MQQQLMDAVMDFVREQGYLPGECLYDLVRQLEKRLSYVACRESNDLLAEALTTLIRDGKLTLHIRKEQFLHLYPTT